MKKVLLLGALLSTMAFGAAGDFTFDGAEATTGEITLRGTAVAQVTINEVAPLDFGTVVAGASKNEVATISLTGIEGKNVKLSATLSGTKKDTLKIEFVESTSGSVTSGNDTAEKSLNADTTAYLAVKYTPATADDSLTGTDTKVLLTAKYE